MSTTQARGRWRQRPRCRSAMSCGASGPTRGPTGAGWSLRGLLIVAIPAIDTVTIWLWKVLIDEVLAPGRFGPFPLIVGGYFVLTLLSGAVGVADDYLSAWLGEHFLLDLRTAVFAHLQRLSPSFLEPRSARGSADTADRRSRCRRDVRALGGGRRGVLRPADRVLRGGPVLHPMAARAHGTDRDPALLAGRTARTARLGLGQGRIRPDHRDHRACRRDDRRGARRVAPLQPSGRSGRCSCSSSTSSSSIRPYVG